ncbi:[Fructose-bisphosphate aldolase]-lysine N-methyltransferase, chloroplastic-like protein [Drosera capensis]
MANRPKGSEEELNEIQGTQLLRTTLVVKELVQGEFQKVEEVVLSHRLLFTSPITLDNFFWAFGTLRSKAFTQLSGESLVLVPLADLVFIQYDLKKSNAELALNYGFIELRPGRITYTLTLEIPESDPFYGDKLDIAEDEKLKEQNSLDPRLEIAVGIRLGKKKALQQIADLFEERKTELAGLEYYQERRLRQLGLVGEEGNLIFWESKRESSILSTKGHKFGAKASM